MPRSAGTGRGRSGIRGTAFGVVTGVHDHAHLVVRRMPTTGHADDTNIRVERVATVPTVGDAVIDQQIGYDVLAGRCAAILNVLGDEAEPAAVPTDAARRRAPVASIVP